MQKLKQEVNNNWSIKYAKNTLDKQEKYKQIKIDIDNTIRRYQAYETFIKWIFNIHYLQRDIKVISEKFPIYKNITQQQLQKLNEMIILPLFKGDFSNIKEEINTPILDCVIWHTIEWIPATCKPGWLSEFPFPIFDKEKPAKNGNYDILMPLSFYNELLLDQKSGDTMIRSWYGLLDQSLQIASGLIVGKGFGLDDEPSNILVKGGQDVDAAIETTYAFIEAVKNTGREILQNIKDAAAAIANAAGAAAASGNAFLDGVVIVGGLVTALFIGNMLFGGDN